MKSIASVGEGGQTMSADPALSTLSPEKRRLLEQRLRRVPSGDAVIPRRPPGVPPVMSDLQKGMFFLSQAASGLTAYNVAEAFRIRGPLDVTALSAALDELVARHEALRTRFLPLPDGGIEIAGTARAELLITSDVDDVDAFVEAEVRREFDLGSGCLLRAGLGRLGPEDHVLVLATHHIVSDAVSKRVLAEELATLYAAYRDHRAPLLEAPALQYPDYAAWQVGSAEMEQDVQWWRSRLEGAPLETGLPLDRPRARASWDGAKHVHRLDESTVRQLGAFARTSKATVFTVLVAALAGLLERYSGQGDVVVGSSFTGRHSPELERVVGLFLNTLPLRIDTSGDPSFSELVARARTTATEVHRHQTVPFERIVEALQPSRELGRNPVFQAVLTVRDGGGTHWELPGLEVETLNYEGGWTKFDLSVIASPAPHGMSLLWQYATALFDAATIERLARQFEQVLRVGIEHPDLPLSALPLATEDDLRSLAAWNDTAAPPSAGCVHERIAAQAAATPDALAVGDESGWISYGELEARANQLAHHLIALGVRPDVRVAICLDRSIDLEVAVLGVLKAGGAYVPLDPEYPRDRLAFMLEDSDALALITASPLREALPPHPTTVLLDEPGALDREPAGAPSTGVTPGDLAYIIYTSGTTGRPKGVAVEHRSVVNSLDWMQTTFGLGPGDTVLQKAPISFDAACWEMLWTPMTGARLFMARPGGQRDARYLAEVVQRMEITFLNLVPAMLGAFLATSEASACRSLRTVISAGEALPEEVKEKFFAVLPWAELHNYYGPTETTISVTGDPCAPGRPVMLGRPATNTRLLVLDSAGGLQPVGMPGELCVAGVQVSRGYLGRPELTAERFVLREGERIYRTGDLAAWQPDGRLRYLGRRDEQVKLRGFRIELPEIETVMAADPDVVQACAVLTTTAAGPALAAYLTLRPGCDRTAAEVRDAVVSRMRERLPQYMLPSAVEVLPQLPVTPVGKLDRRALAARGLPAPVADHVPPSTDTEARLARFWQEALGLDGPVSVADDFFDLGGHSLLAMSLFPKLEREFRVKLPLSMLFEHVTVASQAAVIDAERRRRTAWNSLVPLHKDGTKQPLFVFPDYRGDVLTFRQLLGGLEPDRPVYGVECVGLDGRTAPRTTIEAIAGDCLAAIRTAQPSGPYLFAGYCFGGVVAYEAATQLLAEGEEVSFLGLIEATPYGRRVARRANPVSRFRANSRGPLRDRAAYLGRRLHRRVNLAVSVLCGTLGVRTPAMFVDLREANSRARRRYVTPESPLKVTLFRASAGSQSADDERRRRWELVARGGVETRLLAGEGMAHHSIVQGGHAAQLAEAMDAELARFA